MGAYFPVVDQTAFILMHKFNGVLDGQDMVFSIAVDIIDQRGECCGFPAAGRSCNKHKPPAQLGQSQYLIRQSRSCTERILVGITLNTAPMPLFCSK